MVRRIFACALVAGSVGSATFAGSVAQARPSAQSTTCDIDLLLLFKPGLLFSERNQQLRARGTGSNCVGGGVTSATLSKGTGSGSIGCTSGSGAAVANVLWNTGERSQISVTVDVNGTVTGTVSRGKFVGEDVTASLSVTPLNGDCLFTPVTKAEATGSVSL